MFQTKVLEKIKTHILCSAKFFEKSCSLWDNVGKYGRGSFWWLQNMTQALCIGG